MVKGKNEPGTVDIFIIEDITEEKVNGEPKKNVTNKLIIPLQGIKTDAALRVFGKDSSMILYRSTRLGSLTKIDSGIETDVTPIAKDLVGCNYELTEQGGTKALLMKGKIATKKAGSIVVGIGKTGTEN